MTMIVPGFDDAVVVREADAEVLGWTQLATRLLADSNATGGALSVMRTTIGEGIEGAGRTRIASQPSSSTSWMANCKSSLVTR
jgi:hypothetical protein